VCSKTVSLEEIKKYTTCKECYNKEHPLFSLDKKSLFIQICPTCFRYRNIGLNDKAWNVPEAKVFKEVWMQAIYHFLVLQIPGNEKLDFFIDFIHEPDVVDSGRKKVVWLELTGRERVEDEPREATERVQLKYSVGTCTECAQKRVGYHNSVIQLRTGMKRAENDEMIEQMQHDVEVIAAQTEFHGTAQVTSIEHVTGGVDIKLASKRIGKVVMGQLRKKYCVEVKESFKLVGVDKETGTPMTRQFYAIRLLPFLPGDVLLLPRNGEPCLVLKITSAMVHLVSLASGKVEHAKPEAFTEDSIVFQSGKSNVVEFEVVSLNETDGTMNLMNLATYEERIEVLRPWLGIDTEGVTIKGFYFADTLYYFPLTREIDVEHGSGNAGASSCDEGDVIPDDEANDGKMGDLASEDDDEEADDDAVNDEDVDDDADAAGDDNAGGR
jgi:NMD protein affecting ribosome stability and mRNA decay